MLLDLLRRRTLDLKPWYRALAEASPPSEPSRPEPQLVATARTSALSPR